MTFFFFSFLLLPIFILENRKPIFAINTDTVKITSRGMPRYTRDNIISCFTCYKKKINDTYRPNCRGRVTRKLTDGREIAATRGTPGRWAIKNSIYKADKVNMRVATAVEWWTRRFFFVPAKELLLINIHVAPYRCKARCRKVHYLLSLLLLFIDRGRKRKRKRRKHRPRFSPSVKDNF